MRADIAAASLLAITTVSFASLISGANYLEYALPGGLPAGNALAAIGLVCAAAIPVVLSAPGSALRTSAVVTLTGAAAWLPLSIALAGNLTLNFAGGRGSAWLAFSLAEILAVLCTWVWAFVARLIAMRRRARAT